MGSSFRKFIKATLSFVCTIILAMSVSAQDIVAEPCTPAENQEASPASFIYPDLYEGPGGVIEYRLFILEADNVSGLKTSVNTFTFTKSLLNSLNATTIYIDGLLTSSNPQDAEIAQPFRVGLCYYNSNIDEYYPDKFYYPTPDTRFHEYLCSTSYIQSNTAYYAFVKNLTEGSRISGEVAFYYRKN